MPFKVTLDTNCIINLLDDTSSTRTSYDDLVYILSLVDNGTLLAFITTRFQADQSNDIDYERVTKIVNRLSEIKIETIGTGFRLDMSTLDGNDFLGDESIFALHNELTAILSPNGLNPQAHTFSNRINDIAHLIGHYQNDNDVFITDDGGILRKTETIRKTTGICVMSPSALAKYLRNHIQQSLSAGSVLEDNEYISKPATGTVSFDYSNHNGMFTIGQGILAFDIKFSKANERSIHAYSDGHNIDSIARVADVDSINKIIDVSGFDYSSRSRTIGLNDILLLRNRMGAYSAVKVLRLVDDTRGGLKDLVEFDYMIAPIGNTGFNNI